MKREIISRLTKISLSCSLALSGLALAQQAPADDSSQIEKIEVTGSRLKGVDMEGANPLQVFNRDELLSRGYDSISTFLRDLPQASAGTFNEIGSVSGNDGTPAGSAGVSLRGLGSSSTLVLVNGRRVAVDSFANGADTFVNVNAIPMSAIERVEILTDGASSVYGSDAIAGVINVILKHADHGGSISTKFGEYKKGDGIQRNISGNTGLALGDNGFISLSGEGADNDYTNRAGKDYRTASIGSPTYGQQVLRQGEPATNEGKFQFNSEYAFNDAAEFYTFGGYSKRRGETAAFYRASNASNNIPALNPNGYLPLIKGNLEDTSLVVGLRGL